MNKFKGLLWQFVVPAALLAGFWAFVHYGNVRRATFAPLFLGILLFAFWGYQATAAVIDAIADRRAGAAEPIPDRQVTDAMVIAIGCAIATAVATIGFPLSAELLEEASLWWLGSELTVLAMAIVAGALIGRRVRLLRLAAKAGATIAVVGSACGALVAVFTQMRELLEGFGVFVAGYVIGMVILSAISVGLALVAAAIMRRAAPSTREGA